MPLSEEELRLLEQMERALSEEDPKFASALRGTALRRAQRRRAILDGVLLAGGVALLMTGAVTEIWALGILGFVVMLFSASSGLSALRGRPAASLRPHLHHRTAPRASFLDRAEQRWRRRRHDGTDW